MIFSIFLNKIYSVFKQNIKSNILNAFKSIIYRTALHLAVKNQNVKMIRLLLSYPDIGTDITDYIIILIFIELLLILNDYIQKFLKKTYSID